MRTVLATLVLSGIGVGVNAQTIGDALSKNDTLKVLQLIKSGANIDEVDANGTSALMNACRWGDEAAVSFLLRHGAGADKPRSPKGRTPLMVACAYYSGKSICSMLAGKGAMINAADNGGVTALMLAAQNAKLDVVELLLKNGADANAKDKKGQTALDYANSAEISDYLKSSVKDCRIDKSEVISILKKSMK